VCVLESHGLDAPALRHSLETRGQRLRAHSNYDLVMNCVIHEAMDGASEHRPCPVITRFGAACPFANLAMPPHAVG